MNKTVLYSTTFLADTGADTNFINEAYLRPHWKFCIRLLDLPKLRTETNEPIKVAGITLLILKLGTLQVGPWLDVVENLAVNILLGITYIDRCFKRIISMDRKIVPIHSAPIPIWRRDRNLSRI